jgi:hypothetical protein
LRLLIWVFYLTRDIPAEQAACWTVDESDFLLYTICVLFWRVAETKVRHPAENKPNCHEKVNKFIIDFIVLIKPPRHYFAVMKAGSAEALAKADWCPKVCLSPSLSNLVI